MSQVKLGDRWLAYALPYGAELKRSGAATALDRADWTVTAAGVTPTAEDPLAHLLDGDPATRWSSGEGQAEDMNLTVDLGRAQTFTEVSLDVGKSTGDYLRSYVVQVSDDGASWRSVARGPGRTGEMIIALPETTARYVRISSGASSGSWWSIAELNLRHADLATTPGPVGRDLIRDSDVLTDGSRVVGYYNDGRRIAERALAGHRFRLRLPAAVDRRRDLRDHGVLIGEAGVRRAGTDRPGRRRAPSPRW